MCKRSSGRPRPSPLGCLLDLFRRLSAACRNRGDDDDDVDNSCSGGGGGGDGGGRNNKIATQR